MRAVAVGLGILMLAGAWPGRAAAQAALPTPTPAPSPSPGDVIAAFDAEGIDGVTKHIGFPDGTTTVLLFFMSGCPHCHRMIPEWNRLFASRPSNLAVVGVLMDQEPPGFFRTMPIAFPVVRSPGPDFLRALKVYRAPLTVRVAPRGRIQDVAAGELEPTRLVELFKR